MTTTLMLKLVGDNRTKLRGTLAPDGMQVFSVFDFMTKACGYQDTGAAARKEFKRLTTDGSEHKEEIVASCHSLHFPGQRGPATPCMTIRGLQRLLMILGGKVAAEYRALVESTFTRVMAGDQSLIEVINANAASDAPVQQAYRAALAQEPAAPVLDELCGVKRREREEMELDLELEERRIRIEETRLRLAKAKCEQALFAVETIESIKSKSMVDERTKLQFEDHIKNLILTPSRAVPMITDADQQPQANETAALNVSIVATELGYRKCSDGDLIKMGRALAAKYRETYKRDPPKHKQYVKGNYIPVNSYMERDRPLMELVIRQHMGRKASEETESDRD